MSPLRRQSTIFLQSKLTEELNSEHFWIDGTVVSALCNDAFQLFEGAVAPVEDSPSTTDHPLLSFDDDHLDPPSVSSGDDEYVGFMNFTPDPHPIPFGNQPDDLFDLTYLAAYTELFQNDDAPCTSVPTIAVHELPPPASCDQSVTAITQILAVTHLPPVPVDPSTMTGYAPYFDHVYDSSQAPSTPDNASVASPPSSTTPASSPCHDSSEFDGEGDVDYIPPPHDDEEYCPPVTPCQKEKGRRVASQSKSPRRKKFSPARSTSSESEKSVSSSRLRRRSHPYRRCNTSRNLQRDDGTMLIDKESDFQCPVVGCDYVQKNRRVPDLKRHVVTHDRWMEPGKWTCCGVDMDRAHLYDTGIEEGMTEKEHIDVGAYMFGERLMIGGCMKTFARRDALKRHVDNPNIPSEQCGRSQCLFDHQDPPDCFWLQRRGHHRGNRLKEVLKVWLSVSPASPRGFHRELPSAFTIIGRKTAALIAEYPVTRCC